VVKYLNDLVDIMQANSVNRLVIEWTSFRSQVLSAAGSAQAIADASPAIAVALGLLNDHHSFYQRATGGGISNPRFPSGCAVPAVADATVPADIGYLRIGAFSGNAAAEVALATDLHSRIAAQDRDGLAGWIVAGSGDASATYGGMPTAASSGVAMAEPPLPNSPPRKPTTAPIASTARRVVGLTPSVNARSPIASNWNLLLVR